MTGKSLKINVKNELKAQKKTLEWLAKQLGYADIPNFDNRFRVKKAKIDFMMEIAEKLNIPWQRLNVEPSAKNAEKTAVKEPDTKNAGRETMTNKEKNVGLIPANFYENEIYQPIVAALPTPGNSNGWMIVKMDDEDLGMKPLSLASIISQNNLTLMQKIPQDTLFRIPGAHADRIVLVTAVNTKYAPGSQISISWRNKEDITFGYDYYLVFDDGEECIHIINRGKDDEHWELTSHHPQFYRGNIAVSRIKSIYDITVSLTYTRQKQQLKTH